jgi:hypothetical protein
MFSKLLALVSTASAFTSCWGGYANDDDWYENYSDGSILALNSSRWKLDDAGYNWGGEGAFYSYDGYRQLNQPLPDGTGNALKFSVRMDYCNDNPGVCKNNAG